MNGALGKLILAVPFLLCVALPSHAAEDTATLKKRLRSPDPQTARKALDALLVQGEAGRKEAQSVLSGLLEVRGKALAKELKGLRALLRKVEDPKMLKELEKGISDWKSACEDVVNFVFSDDTYPATYGGTFSPGECPQPGQIILEARTEHAGGLFNQLEAKFLKALGKKVRCPRVGGLGVYGKYKQGRLKDNDTPLKIVTYHFLDGTKEWKSIASRLAKKYLSTLSVRGPFHFTRDLANKAGMKAEDKFSQESPLAHALGALFAKDYAAARAARSAAGSTEQKLFDICVRRHIVLLNHEARLPWTRDEQTVFHSINQYRTVLGLWPVKVNPKLTSASKEHSNWQAKKRKTVYSELVSGLDGPEERMKRHGYRYPAVLGEFVFVESVKTVLWEARMDCAPHRRMIKPSYRTGGVAFTAIYLTLNFGTEIEDKGLNELVNR